jgi:DNA-binding PadR family transcriptional regulator
MNKLLLLGILMEGKMHGYQLNDHVQHVMSLYTDLKKSTTYFVLDQLEKDGYVTFQIEREGKRPERRVYEITKKGKAYFFELLREHLSNYTPVMLSDDISIAFMDKLKSSEVEELLLRKKGKIGDELTKLRSIGEHGGNLKYALDHSLAYVNADLNWVNSMLQDLKGGN